MSKIFKQSKKSHTLINDSLIEDNRLSFFTKGVYLFLASRQEKYNFSVADIAKYSASSEAEIEEAISELLNVGYLVKSKTDDYYIVDKLDTLPFLPMQKKVKIKEIEFAPPTQKEVLDFVVKNSLLVDAQLFFNYFDCAGWHDAKGKKVTNWKQKLFVWGKRNSKNKNQAYYNRNKLTNICSTASEF